MIPIQINGMEDRTTMHTRFMFKFNNNNNNKEIESKQ